MKLKTVLFAFIFIFSLMSEGQEKKINHVVNGVIPSLTMPADHYPLTAAGIGTLMPWPNRLRAVTDVAHLSPTGSKSGLFEIDNNLRLKNILPALWGLII